MNASDLRKHIFDIANELKTLPAFLEKDLYVSKVLALLSSVEAEHFHLTFGGGTSLLKAHRIIQRFSEDIDFKAIYTGDVKRSDYREFKKQIIALINDHDELSVIDDSVLSRNSSQFFSCMIQYPKTFEGNASIRPDIKLEVTFIKSDKVTAIEKTLIPIIGEYVDLDIKSQLLCVSASETMSDKISAFTWRALSRDRSETDDDETIIRHLYDLSLLYGNLKGDVSDIWAVSMEVYKVDANRVSGIPSDLGTAFSLLIDKIQQDPLYKEEYEQFVTNMCFGGGKRLTFETALKTLLEIKAHAWFN